MNKQIDNNNINALKILIGNKIDKSDRIISEQEGRELANKLGIKFFFETSVKTSQNVNKLFEEACLFLCDSNAFAKLEFEKAELYNKLFKYKNY